MFAQTSYGLVGLEVVVDGHPLQEYSYQVKTVIQGTTGLEYTLRISNRSRRRITVAMSVDGLSVMDGRLASKNDTGYIAEIGGTVLVPGWRLDSADVAHFYFGRRPEVYAQQMGKPQNLGVIGAAFYFEKMPGFGLYNDAQFEDFDGQLSGEPLMTYKGGIGTGFGRRTPHKVNYVNFDREFLPAAVLQIHYLEASEMIRRGIIFTHERPMDPLDAQAFPADEEPRGATPPPGWRGW